MGSLTHALRNSCDWQVIALARSSMAMIFAAVLALSAGAQLVFLRPGTLWIRSIAGSLSLACTFFAMTRLPLADVLTLTNMFPLWVALLSWPLLKEPPSEKVWQALASGLLGVILIQQPHLARGDVASLLALAASFFTAVAMLGLHRLRDLDTRAIVVHFSGVATLICVASFFFFDHRPTTDLMPNGWALLGLLGIGVSATVGQIFLTKAFSSGPPTKVSIVGLSQIFFAVVVDVLVFDHPLRPSTLLGMVLVVAPTAWVLSAREEHETAETESRILARPRLAGSRRRPRGARSPAAPR
jgi:drug/metabolite transporter (DMT)-like permease